MNISLIKQEGNERLVLIFAGWGMDARPFGSLTCDGYDMAVAWDYADETFDKTAISGYREVVVIAWSLGVFEANRLLPLMDLPVTLTVAVNGTLFPVDDSRGIPEAVFNGTLATLSEASLVKFNRRMCGGADRYSRFDAVRPGRDVESLRRELSAVGRRAVTEVSPAMHWDVAVIGGGDRIFPPDNQQRAWANVRRDLLEREPHLPDFRDLIARYVVDKQLVASRFGNTRDSYDTHASVQRRVADRLMDLWHQHLPRRHYDTAVEIGAGTGIMTRSYAGDMSIDRLELWDIAGVNVGDVGRDFVEVNGDAEIQLPVAAPESVDLLVSSSTMQWFNSPATFLRNVSRVLKPGAHVVVSLYGEGTFDAMRRAIGLSLNYVSLDDMKSAAEGLYDMIYIGSDEIEERFDSAADALRHLQSTGVNSLKRRPVAVEQMRRLLADESMSRLLYRPIYMILKRK